MTEQDIFHFVAAKTPNYPSLAEVMARLDYDNETYPNLEAHLIVLKIAKNAADYAKAFKAGERRYGIVAKLGTVPTNTEELLNAVLDKTGFQLDANAANPLSWISPIRHARVRLEADELINFAGYLNRNVLSNVFRASDIASEVEYTLINFNEGVRKALVRKLTRTGATFDWHAMATTCFDNTLPAELTVAVLQKFIWQVKRRLVGLPVTYHLMPVLYGSQGCGKSVFVTKILAELGSLWTNTDFGRIADNREATLFRNYALFLDEMHKGDRADMDKVKEVITRDQFSYRPMATNTSVMATQNATFIGASNKLLEQLINDPTGTRRFFQLNFNSSSGPIEFAFVNSLDFGAMWASVDHTAADPSLPYFDDIKAIQAGSTNKSSVGEFAEALVENNGCYRAPSTYSTQGEERELAQGVLSRDDLYLAYRDWCAVMKKKAALEQAGFFNELRRMAAQESNFPFIAKRTNKCNGWLYTGPVSQVSQVVTAIRKVK